MNPLKDSALSRNCTAVRRTMTNAKPEDVCIGTSSFAQLTDRRGQLEKVLLLCCLLHNLVYSIA